MCKVAGVHVHVHVRGVTDRVSERLRYSLSSGERFNVNLHAGNSSIVACLRHATSLKVHKCEHTGRCIEKMHVLLTIPAASSSFQETKWLLEHYSHLRDYTNCKQPAPD